MAKEQYRYDNKGNLVQWSDKTGKWVVVKSASQIKKEQLAASRKKMGNAIANLPPDTARRQMAENRKKREKLNVSKNLVAKGEPRGSGKPPSNNSSTPTKPQQPSSLNRKSQNISKPTKTVSQSRTMWVKKGDVVGGVEVKKGYLAQYGKPEKKVSARVEMVTGPKKGKAVEYTKGRKSKGGK